MAAVVQADFRPAWWLPGPHLQTLWASLARHGANPPLQRERLTLPDGDFLDLDWIDSSQVSEAAPIVLVLHGLEGSSRSGYAQRLLMAVAERGWRGVVMHFRGCSGVPNRLAASYCAGVTEDLSFVVEHLGRRWPEAPLAVVGYSLGGNMLLKWLGERGRAAPVNAAVAVSVPFLLERAARRMTRGVSRLYQWHLLRACKASYRAKFADRDDAPVSFSELGRVRDFFAFDDRITAPLHGYAGVEDYYARASCRQYLAGIETPTLILHALDDPFLTPDVVPTAEELGPGVTLELSDTGGHVGFVEGWGRYWLERRIGRFIDDSG